eukprot:g75102.t1
MSKFRISTLSCLQQRQAPMLPLVIPQVKPNYISGGKTARGNMSHKVKPDPLVKAEGTAQKRQKTGMSEEERGAEQKRREWNIIWNALTEEEKENRCQIVNWHELTDEQGADARLKYQTRKVKISVKINTMDGTSYEVKVQRGLSVSRIRDAVAQKQGLNAENLRLLHDGQRLRMDAFIHDFLQDGDEIDVMVMQSGGSDGHYHLWADEPHKAHDASRHKHSDSALVCLDALRPLWQALSPLLTVLGEVLQPLWLAVPTEGHHTHHSAQSQPPPRVTQRNTEATCHDGESASVASGLRMITRQEVIHFVDISSCDSHLHHIEFSGAIWEENMYHS